MQALAGIPGENSPSLQRSGIGPKRHQSKNLLLSSPNVATRGIESCTFSNVCLRVAGIAA